MSLLEKVSENPIICKIGLDFSRNLSAVNSKELQNFFNSEGNQYTWQNTHFGRRSVSFRETEKITAAGSEFTQELKIKIPSVDKNRADRITFIKQAKFIRIELSNGLMLVLGRNDFFQNKLPLITTKSDLRSTTITFKTKSIFSIGFLEVNDVSDVIDFLIPLDIPINLINI